MPCGCSKRRQQQILEQTSATRVMATCPTCTEALLGSDGILYPVQETVVIVPQYQVDQWREQGYDIVIPEPV